MNSFLFRITGLMRACLTLFGILWFGAFAIRAADRYVSPPGGYGTNDSANGYTNWAGAATNIQWAINVATNGETVRVTNGTYYLTNEISITNAITVQSVNGRDKTFVNGNYPAYTNRCFRIIAKAVIDGFAVFNGFAVTNSPDGPCGGGVYMGRAGWYSVTGTIRNCTISGNIVSNPAGPGIAYGGGVVIYGIGYIYNCIICFNLNNAGTDVGGGGGGVFLYSGDSGGGVVSNCVIFTNTVYRSATVLNQPGGGIYNAGGTVVNCTIYSNYCIGRGGGINCSAGSTILRNSSIYKNSSGDNGAGIYTDTATTENCLVYGNIGYGARFDKASVIRNCTFVKNTSGGAMVYSVTVGAQFENTVSYYDGAADISRSGTAHPIFTNCCTGTAGTIMTNGSGNITDAPMFVNTNADNYRLANNSPCINRGANRDWMTNAVDLDSRMRIRYGIVDMGAYERVHEGTVYRFH